MPSWRNTAVRGSGSTWRIIRDRFMLNKYKRWQKRDIMAFRHNLEDQSWLSQARFWMMVKPVCPLMRLNDSEHRLGIAEIVVRQGKVLFNYGESVDPKEWLASFETEFVEVWAVWICVYCGWVGIDAAEQDLLEKAAEVIHLRMLQGYSGVKWDVLE